MYVRIPCHLPLGHRGLLRPIDFPEPLYDELPDGDPHCIEGGILGSSQGAMRELVRVAPLLDISLTAGILGDEQEIEHPDAAFVEEAIF